MDKNTILSLIKKDLAELNILVDELSQAEMVNPIVLNLSETKLTSVNQEFELLKFSLNSTLEDCTIEPITLPKSETNIGKKEILDTDVQENEVKEEFRVESTIKVEPKKPEIIAEIKPEENVSENIEETVDQVADNLLPEQSLEVLDNELDINQISEPIVDKLVETSAKVELEEEERKAIICEKDTAQLNKEPMKSVEKEDPIILKKEDLLNSVDGSKISSSPINEKKTVGESFSAKKSIHEKIKLASNTNSKFSGAPIQDLTKAVGLNDKFVFIRELFENNADRYAECIEIVNRSENLEHAISILEKNYQLPETEIREKFFELVYRRFLN